MNEKYLLIVALAPTAMSLIGIIFAKSDLRDFKAEVRARFDKLEAKFDRLESKVDKSIDASHKDALSIMASMISLHERVAVVEAKQKAA